MFLDKDKLYDYGIVQKILRKNDCKAMTILVKTFGNADFIVQNEECCEMALTVKTTLFGNSNLKMINVLLSNITRTDYPLHIPLMYALLLHAFNNMEMYTVHNVLKLDRKMFLYPMEDNNMLPVSRFFISIFLKCANCNYPSSINYHAVEYVQEVCCRYEMHDILVHKNTKLYKFNCCTIGTLGMNLIDLIILLMLLPNYVTSCTIVLKSYLMSFVECMLICWESKNTNPSDKQIMDSIKSKLIVIKKFIDNEKSAFYVNEMASRTRYAATFYGVGQ